MVGASHCLRYYAEKLKSPGAAYVSMQRIEKFLAEPEVPDWASSLKRSAEPTSSNDTEIGFENATFEWDVAPTEAPARFTLGPLDIRFPPGKLTVVSGPTGSGKSALLVALLGGMSAFVHGLAECSVRFQRCIAHPAESS